MKKCSSVSRDFGEGFIGSVICTDEEVTQEMLDGLYAAYVELVPKIYKFAMEHLDYFTAEEQELIKLAAEA